MSDEEKTASDYAFSGYEKETLSGKKAKKNHLIVQNDFRADIKRGDDLSEIPARFYETLKTEKVI